MKEKRGPTLADRFLANTDGIAEAYLHRDYLDSLRRKVRAARKFVMDEKAAAHIAHVVRDVPDLLVREHEFARAPFDLTWIEFPFWKFWTEVGNDPRYQDGTCDHTLGYLIDGDEVVVIVGGTMDEPDLGPLPSVLKFHLNTRWPREVMEKFVRDGNTTLEGLDGYLWGSTAARLDAETLAQLRERFSVSVAPIRHDDGSVKERRMLHAAYKGSIGEMRNMLAMLLMLNRPTVTRHVDALPTTRGWIKGKPRPYMAHTTVTIDLDPVPTMRLLGTPAGDAVPKRRHEVRGHFCHDHEARDYARIAGCAHDWLPADEFFAPISIGPIQVNHWVCNDCGGKRWWREAHERGDATLGYMAHDDYSITSHKGRN